MANEQTARPQLDADTKPLMGIGSCLAGNEVRYNGLSKRPNEHVRQLQAHFKTRSFCPEMGIGLGVPRPPIHLVGDEQVVRVLDVDTHQHDNEQFAHVVRGRVRFGLGETGSPEMTVEGHGVTPSSAKT